MAILEYGKWVLDVDVEKTKENYSNHPAPEQTQTYRNYKKYCENMPVEEREFFSNFGIDPLCCEPQSFGITKEKTLPTRFYFFVVGKYLSCHTIQEMTVKEFIENDLVDTRDDPRIIIGNFIFNFILPDSAEKAGIPEGCICIEAWCEDMPWLLREKCSTKMYYPPRPWQIIRKIRERTSRKKEHVTYQNEPKSTIEADFTQNNIPYKLLGKQDTKQLYQTWIQNFIPHIDENIIKKYSIYGNKRYQNYLWHSFSYELLPTETPENAPLRYSETQKKNCYVLLLTEDIAYNISNAENLDVSIINEYYDILVFDTDFTFTYCHTHEEYCGPYFYNKNAPKSI